MALWSILIIYLLGYSFLFLWLPVEILLLNDRRASEYFNDQ